MANPLAAEPRKKNRRSQSYRRGAEEDDNVTTVALLVMPLPPMSTVRLLVASLGNPPPYQSTRHSAGHILLRAFASSHAFPAPTRNKDYAGAFISTTSDYPQYTLYQSPTLMNVSGPTLLRAWTHFSALHSQSAITGLVVLHDDLESASGKLKLKRGEGSPKGHNGLKSVQASFQGAGILAKLAAERRIVKIGVGIGRPISRERDDVSDYVLGPLPSSERQKIETTGVEELGRLLENEVGLLAQL